VCAALAAGAAFPRLTRIKAECLKLSCSHVDEQCGALCSLVLDHGDEQAVRGLLQPAGQLTCTTATAAAPEVCCSSSGSLL
jgi:hypothetical protein